MESFDGIGIQILEGGIPARDIWEGYVLRLRGSFPRLYNIVFWL